MGRARGKKGNVLNDIILINIFVKIFYKLTSIKVH